MTTLFESLLTRRRGDDVGEPRSLDQLLEWFTFNGMAYPLGANATQGRGETIETNFAGLAAGALKGNGVVFSCIVARMLLFSEVEFRFQRLADRKLFGTPALSLLEEPARNRVIGEVLALMEIDASLAGNSYWTRRYYGGGRRPFLRRLRPDWVEILSGSPEGSDDADGLDSEVLGYLYTPGGPMSGRDPVFIDAGEVAHFSPIPDPVAQHRGMSWLSPIIDEITADSGFTRHRKAFIDNAAIVPYAISYPDMSAERFERAVDAYKKNHEGAGNSWRAFHLAGGADVKPLGMNLKELDFKAVQALGETRVAAAARVPATVVGISEGLAGSSLNSGNYGMARRQFGDGYGHPYWRMAAASMAPLVDVPAGARLWYDASQVSFLREDHKDLAEVQARQAEAIRQLVDGGFEAESVVTAVTTGDMTLLSHSGMTSVQLHAPGSESAATN